MLFLLFRLGVDRFALDIQQVVEVLPLVEITPITQAPAAVAGILNYRGAAVPVVDLSLLMLDRPALKRLNTRILIVNFLADGGAAHLLGLIAERATETARLDPDAFRASGVIGADAQHRSSVCMDGDGMIQRIDVNQLLPPSMRTRLFQPLPAAS